ncbi:KpsF/GutQ family sugar-phosphate isomerase, partial [Candidatus Glomeribacter gigasporarum]|uniref:KpsF/GutQ family sugar-phosphate isomerase n=1 Tax=Candidatus Glomeribacter gigasporarum TaxID=132144 RepID=UPI0005B2A236
MIAQPSHIDSGRALELARQVIETEASAVCALAQRLGQNFVDAVELLLGCVGKAVVSGIGKSGHIARKLAATLASTGTPAFFVHPAEAGHGDLGMIGAHDVVLILSNSGETEELLNIIPRVKRLGARLIAMTGRPESNLSKLADVHLDIRVEKEACPLNLAPTASTAAALALGDALAVAVFDARGFSAEDFAHSHPGGALGRRLLIYVRDVMHTGARLPRVNLHSTVFEALFEMT